MKVMMISTGFLYYFDKMWIDAEHERCQHLIKEYPHVPVANQQTLELYAKLLHDKVNAEARLELLRQAIQADGPAGKESIIIEVSEKNSVRQNKNAV